MTSTSKAIEQFPKLMSDNSTKFKQEQIESIATTIEKVTQQNPTAYAEDSVANYLKKRAVVLDNLIEQYFIASVAVKYPYINNKMFDLKRQIAVVWNEEGKSYIIGGDVLEKEALPKDMPKSDVNIELPLFIYAPLFINNHQVKIADYYLPKIDKRVEIKTTLPGSVGPDLKDAYRNALSDYYSILSKMYADIPATVDLMVRKLSKTKAEVGAIWIPTTSSLELNVTFTEKVANRDPAMILSVDGFAKEKLNFLVRTWNVENEEPFQQYLREYTTGNIAERPLKLVH